MSLSLKSQSVIFFSLFLCFFFKKKKILKIFKSLKPRIKLFKKKKIIPLGLEDLIGNTPIVKLKKLSEFTKCEIFVKLELNNPGGSSKDRVALSIIKKNEKLNKIKPDNGDVIFEATSGSTGISLTLLANSLGYSTNISVNDNTSIEKINLLKSIGAKVNVHEVMPIFDPKLNYSFSEKEAKKFNEDVTNGSNAIYSDQFETDYNWVTHYETTGPEIWKQMNHKIDYFVHGSGTGGTIAGVSKFLKEKNTNIKVILADPEGSGFSNRIKYGVMYNNTEKEGLKRRNQVDTLVEGIGLNRMTHNFEIAEGYINDSISVSDQQAIKMAKFLCVKEGFFWGPSAAVNCVVSLKIAMKYGSKKRIITIACDSGHRYLSTFWKKVDEIPNNITIDDILNSS